MSHFTALTKPRLFSKKYFSYMLLTICWYCFCFYKSFAHFSLEALTVWQITCMFDNFNNFSVEERHKLSACESLHSWSSYHLALCPIAGNQMLLVMMISMMMTILMTMIFYSPLQRVFQSSEVFLFPDDCAQSSLVPVWQSSLPFCQVI